MLQRVHVQIKSAKKDSTPYITTKMTTRDPKKSQLQKTRRNLRKKTDVRRLVVERGGSLYACHHRLECRPIQRLGQTGIRLWKFRIWEP